MSMIQEFQDQDGKDLVEMSIQEAVNKVLKDLPSYNFFFLYMIGLNIDYKSLKLVVEKFTDIVTSDKIVLKNYFLIFQSRGPAKTSMRDHARQIASQKLRSLMVATKVITRWKRLVKKNKEMRLNAQKAGELTNDGIYPVINNGNTLGSP